MYFCSPVLLHRGKKRLFDAAKLRISFDITKIITQKVYISTKIFIMSFREYYQSLKYQPSPAATFIKEIATLCDRAEIAVRKWLAGDAVPEMKVQIKISQFLNIPVEELFPESKTKNKRKSDGNH